MTLPAQTASSAALPLRKPLPHRQRRVLAAFGTPASAIAAKQATGTIPIVFVTGSDPVSLDGLVATLSRPEGNLTGVTLFTSDLGPKRLGLVRELTKVTTTIAVLKNPSDPAAIAQRALMQAAANTTGVQIAFFDATNETEIDEAIAAVAGRHCGALVVMPSGFFNTRREQIVTQANKHDVPAIYESREFALAGGLMSYGTSYADVYRQAGVYAGRILSGVKPSELPVLQPTKFEFVINLKTAKALGLDVPYSMQLLADEVIE